MDWLNEDALKKISKLTREEFLLIHGVGKNAVWITEDHLKDSGLRFSTKEESEKRKKIFEATELLIENGFLIIPPKRNKK